MDKKILCKNIVNYGVCSYLDKCTFAHSLKEQRVTDIRREIYDIINNKKDVSECNLITNTNMFKTLILMTRLCKECERKQCNGGYNCVYGSCCQEYKICYEDLMRGKCSNMKCEDVHLTAQNLVPYYKQKQELNLSSSASPITPSKIINNYKKKKVELEESEKPNILNQIQDLVFARKVFSNEKVDLDDSDDEFILKLTDSDSDKSIFD